MPDLTRFTGYRLWGVQRGLCFYCNEPMILQCNEAWHPRLASRDHFIPKSLDAPLTNNFVFACCECNTKAQSHLPTAEELARFIELYTAAGKNPSWVIERMRERGITIDEVSQANWIT